MTDSNGLVRCARYLRLMALAVVLLLLLCPGVGPSFPLVAQAQTFSDQGFSAEVVTTLPQFLPVGVTWASDGRMFIWQRNGVIRIYKNGQLLTTPFLDISANVNTFDDRGMLGLALHPNFAVNGYVYVIYVREDGGNPNDSNPKTERLSRFIANSQNPDVALPNSETVLMTISTDYHHHENGTLKFGSDGRLFVGHGEDTTANTFDANAFAAQNLNDPRGKILRITEDGNAPGDNPFDDGTNSIRSKVYSYGLRNPFRFTLHPVSGEPYIGDVGWNTWEEFSRGRGNNFGWPCYEGVNPQPEYQNAFPAECGLLTSGVVTAPLISYPHPGTPAAGSAPFVGNSAIGGPFYIATVYPEAYRNTWFITDYAAGWIRRMTFDQTGNMTGTVPFATGLNGPVDMELGPDGLLYYVEINTGRVIRVRYNGPTAVAAATPSSGYSALTVNFSSAGSSGPSGTSLSYLWDFGDGQTSTVANPTHTYTSSTVQTFTARLTVTTSTNQSSAATVKVTVGSVPPNPPTIQAPSDGTGVLPGQTVVYQGSATDPDDGTIPPSGLKWTVLLHHNDHTHTQLFTTGSTGSVSIQYHGIGTYSYEFQLSATDSSGLSRTTSVNLPVLSDTIKPSDPSGLVGTAISPSQVNLTWAPSTDNSGSVGYQVERCQGAGCTNFLQIASVGTTSYSDTNVAGGTVYNYRVGAKDSTGNVSQSFANTTVTTGGTSGGAGLVTAMGMNEGTGTTLADNSGSGHTGTLVNGPLWAAGQATYGQSVSFDGVNDAVSVANPDTYNFGTADFTIEFWVKRNVLGGGQRHLFSKCGATTWAVGCKELYFSSGNQLVFGSFNTGDTFAGTIADTNWHHVAVTFADSTNTLLMYVDGVQVATATKALEADGAGHVVTLGNMHGSNPFSGQLDELRIYNRVLPLAQINTDRTTPIEPSGSGDTTPPSTVAGLNATASGTQINLNWTAATDNIAVAGYRVERCQGAGCTVFAQVATPTGTTFSDLGLAVATAYSYRVKAVDAAGNVSVNYSNVATATTAADTTAPTTPTGLTATVGANQITLTWAASTDNGGSGLAGYEVLRCQGAGCTSFALIATISTTSYTDTGLTANTSYSYRIQAVDGALNRSSAASISATTGGGGGGTGLVTALGMNEGSGTALADASGAGHTGTLVNGPLWAAGQATYGQSVSFDGVNDAVSVANPNTYNFGTADFTIELWVKRNVLGGGQRHLLSKCAAATWVAGCKELYLRPNNQLAFGSFSTSDTIAGTIGDTNWHHIAVTFTDSTNTLRMYVDGALITTATRALEADGATHLVTLGNMHGSNPFSGQLDELRIYNRVLTLAEIQTDRTTPIAPGSTDSTPPSTVVGLSATAVIGPQINLSWTAATDNIAVTGYRVERCQNAGCTIFAQVATPSGTTFSDTGLVASTSYSYRVKAADAAGNVSVNYSNVATTTTVADTTAPTTPTGLAASAGTNQITLTWASSTDTGGSGLTGYEVLRCQGAGCNSFTLITTISTTNYADTGLTANTSYTYQVRAVDGAGNRSSSVSISATTGSGGGGGTGLVTALGMNEGTGTTLADGSGNNHTGALVNGPLWVASQATYGQSVSFDGVNDAVSIANPTTYNFGTADFTIELWVKRNVLGGGQRHLVSKCDATTWAFGCKELYFNASNQLVFGSFSTGDVFGSTIVDTNWHHVAVTFVDSTNTLRMYVDGALITAITQALEADGATHVVTLGNLHGSNPFSGQLDEVRVYNRALSLTEIQTDRSTPIVP